MCIGFNGIGNKQKIRIGDTQFLKVTIIIIIIMADMSGRMHEQ